MFQRFNLSDDSWIDFRKLYTTSARCDYSDGDDKAYKSLFSKTTFNDLWEKKSDKITYVTVFGKTVPTPRIQANYGTHSYTFSGNTLLPENTIEDSIYSLYLALVNSLGYGDFNELVVNCYANGNNYIGAHQDKEGKGSMLPGSEVITLTLCEPDGERTLRFRDYTTKKVSADYTTYHGSCYIMGGKTQKEFTHEIVKIAGKKGESVGKRISLTFRKF